jgi:serine/threonine-protein kinase
MHAVPVSDPDRWTRPLVVTEPTSAPQSRVFCAACRGAFRTPYPRCPRDGSELTASADPLPWSMLAGRYLVGPLIAEGGVARVYRGRDVRTGTPIAIKVLVAELALTASHRDRFAREIAAGRRLDHPNLVGVRDDGITDEGLHWLVMDLAQGVTLRAMLLARIELPPERVLAIVAQIAAGLDHAHRRGLIHRDLKPSNVVVSVGEDGTDHARIVDLGSTIASDPAHAVRITDRTRVFGTPEYLTPEHMRRTDLDERADLFALGLVLFELLAGVRPFSGTPLEVARLNATAPWPRIADRAPGRVVDPLIEGLTRWLLERDRLDRPPDAQRVIEVVNEIRNAPESARLRLSRWL